MGLELRTGVGLEVEVKVTSKQQLEAMEWVRNSKRYQMFVEE